MQLNPLFMAQALYQLGKYDTYTDNGDGTTTITRQTGYITVDGTNIKVNNVGFSYYLQFNFSTNDCFSFNSLVASQFGTATNLSWNGTDKGWYIDSTASNTLVLKAIGETVKTVTEWNDYFSQNPIQIQYKLSEATTENVITGLSIANY